MVLLPSKDQILPWLDSLLSLIFPPRCRACDVFVGLDSHRCFCETCSRLIDVIGPPVCPVCGYPFQHAAGRNHRCGQCLLRVPYFLRARSWAGYPRDSENYHPLRRVIHRFKYGRTISVGKVLGRLMAEGCQHQFTFHRPELVVPVPLHPKRLRWRGFNQAVVLGREVSRLWHVPLDPCVLLRTRQTQPQTELKREERRANVRGAFVIKRRRSVRGLKLLLLDDVYTSGATVNECSRTLRRGGARSVQVLTLARTV